ncbi:MAG: hypothetical protein Q8P41_31365 [Pseudomonadota bacterium]|nr:hypothetical protein [Pseudomonadota bacterium]
MRAALVAFHLVAITLSGLPSPEGGLNRATWAEPTVQVEFAAWAKRFGMEQRAFEDALWEFANTYNRGYKQLLTPVKPYEDLIGSEQSWKMFIAPHRFPTKLEIAGRGAGGEWGVLFLESSPTATWRADLLRLERLRSSIFRWGWPNYSSAWSKGCGGIAALAFADFPELDEVRCRFWKARTPSPEQARSGDLPVGQWTSPRLVRRGKPGVPLVVERPTPTGAAPSTAPVGAAAADVEPTP